MRRLIIGVVLLAVLTGPVYAQGRGGPRQDTPEDIQKKKDAEALDKQYTSTLKRMNKDEATPVRNDPWANMRAPADNKR